MFRVPYSFNIKCKTRLRHPLFAEVMCNIFGKYPVAIRSRKNQQYRNSISPDRSFEYTSAVLQYLIKYPNRVYRLLMLVFSRAYFFLRFFFTVGIDSSDTTTNPRNRHGCTWLTVIDFIYHLACQKFKKKMF